MQIKIVEYISKLKLQPVNPIGAHKYQELYLWAPDENSCMQCCHSCMQYLCSGPAIGDLCLSVTQVAELIIHNLICLQTHHHSSLQVSSYGYSSVAQLVSAVSVCQVERPTGLGDWLVFLRGLPTPEGNLYITTQCTVSCIVLCTCTCR